MQYSDIVVSKTAFDINNKEIVSVLEKMSKTGHCVYYIKKIQKIANLDIRIIQSTCVTRLDRVVIVFVFN